MFLYKALGIFFVGLATLGIILPVLPTTPFLLLAAGCFAKSSETWHKWLLTNSTFGPIIRDWQDHRCISRKTKIAAVLSILIFGGFSIVFAIPVMWAKAITAVLLAWGIFVIYQIDVCK